jgi:hypothetical protein
MTMSDGSRSWRAISSYPPIQPNRKMYAAFNCIRRRAAQAHLANVERMALENNWLQLPTTALVPSCFTEGR